ncbi:MAG: hypothetical protein IGS03_16555 [Candidatus Sericytochromatia bacterium]|nr:hypothetical protein [Candidatus Sericytochromatia bacterium]
MSAFTRSSHWLCLLFLSPLYLSGCPASTSMGPIPVSSLLPVSTATPAPVTLAAPTATPVLSATPGPEPQSTATVTPVPIPTPTPVSTATPEPMPTPAPIATPMSLDTPVPTPTATPEPTPTPSAAASEAPLAVNKAFHASGQTLRPDETEAELLARGVPSVVSGSTRFFIGYQQVSANNQNPVLVRFDQGVQTWMRSDYETSGDDSRGYGLLWDGTDDLYAVFSSTGTQGDSSQDFRRFAQQGWLKSYGAGGGPKVAVLARIDPASGDVTAASFVSARLSNGNSNSLQVTDLALQSNTLTVSAKAWFSPRNPDTTPMRCSGSSPFASILDFSLDLRQVLQASAENCSPE